jgi:hypothetical protein
LSGHHDGVEDCGDPILGQHLLLPNGLEDASPGAHRFGGQLGRALQAAMTGSKTFS